MKVVIVGCGRAGSTLAYQLFRKGHQVTVIDQAAAAFEKLPPDFVGRTIEGDVLDQDVLRRAGLGEAEGLAAVTNVDSVNAVIAYLARTVYHLPNVVVRNYDPRWRPIHEAFDLQVVSSASWSAQRIEELLSASALRAIFSAGNAEVEIYELVVPDAWQGHRLDELIPAGTGPAVAGQVPAETCPATAGQVSAGNCLAVALARTGRAILPSRDIVLEAGDLVYLSSTLEGIEALRQRLENPALRTPVAPEVTAPVEEAASAVMVVPEKPGAGPAAVTGGTATPAKAAAKEEK